VALSVAVSKTTNSSKITKIQRKSAVKDLGHSHGTVSNNGNHTILDNSKASGISVWKVRTKNARQPSPFHATPSKSRREFGVGFETTIETVFVLTCDTQFRQSIKPCCLDQALFAFSPL
jgi:hypothetical protein